MVNVATLIINIVYVIYSGHVPLNAVIYFFFLTPYKQKNQKTNTKQIKKNIERKLKLYILVRILHQST